MEEAETTSTRCTECQGSFAFSPSDAGTLGQCPHCKINLVLRAEWSAPGKAPQLAANARLLRLEEIRAASCYPRLRDFINVVAWIVLVAGCIAGALEMVGAVSYLSSSELGGQEPSFFAGLVEVVASVVFFMVFRPAAALLVDMADLLIDQAARRG